MPRKNSVPQSELYTKTLQLLRDRPRTTTLQMIADGTGVTIFWLASLASNPDGADVNRIVILYEFLSGNKLKLA